MNDDLVYLRKIVRSIYDNHALVAREWIEPSYSKTKNGISDKDADWVHILDENIAAIERADLVIVEGTQARFSQGFQVYNASQRKKPTLIVTRSTIENSYISGIESEHVSIKRYSSESELESIVAKFIKQNMIAEKNLRLNLILDRRILKYLRDESYESGKNKSTIIRGIIEKAIKRREN
jgi:hypothetical protein